MKYLDINRCTDFILQYVKSISCAKKLTFALCFAIALNLFTSNQSQAENKPTNTKEQSTTRQGITVTGTVSDETGMGFPGVRIMIKGTSTGVLSLIDGKYTINVPNNSAVLEFSFIGWATQDVIVGNRTVINIILKEDVQHLEEVVVIGYGTQRKKDLSGSVVRANLDAMEESPNVNLLSALQGLAPGLNIGAVTQAGQNPSISIRGRNSINGTSTPLIVLDGIIYRGDLIDINPNDVESIDVLKDASAAAIYGSQASNGVILITSKTGNAGSPKPTITYSSTFSLQEVSNKDMLPVDGAGFLKKIADRYLSESRIGADMLTMNPDWDPTTHFYGSEILGGYQNGVETNWWKLLTNKNPYIQNHNINVTGKTDQSSYFFSLGYTDQQNVVVNDTYKRYSFRINLDSKITNWMKVGIQSFLSLNDLSGVSPSIGNLVGLPPQVPYQDSEGNYVLQPYRGTLNPFLQMDQQDLDKRMNLFGNIYLDIDIPFVKGLNYRLNYSQNLINARRYNFNGYAQTFRGEGYKRNTNTYSYTVDNILSYRRSFGPHAVNGTLVYGVEERKREETEARARIFDSHLLGYNKLAMGQADQQTATSEAWQEASLYAMLRLGYVYNDRYIFTGTVRRDGFSGFGSNEKFGIFPSAAVAWRISQEKFMEPVSFIYDLKLRLSYGTNGNRTVDRYQTLARIESTIGNGYLYGDKAPAELGQRVNALANNDLKWETTNSFNYGIDYSLFSNRVFGSIDGYVSKTHDLLYNINIPRMNGFTTIPMNIGKLKNTGIEIAVTGVPVKKKDLTWTVTGNFSLNRNEVVSILGQDNDGDGKEDDLVSNKIFMGHPYGVCYDYNIIGMWQVADHVAGIIPAGFTYGTYKVEDIDGSGTYTADKDRKILGYQDPSYRFSILNTLKYKDFELKFFINSIQGGKKYYYGQPGSSVPNPDNVYSSNMFDFDYWTPENPDARYKQLGYYTVALGESFSPYIQRSFVRLQDVTLSYNIPRSFLNKIKINRARVYVNGKNLLTISDWDGWDPESGSGLSSGSYPVLRSYSIGLNVEF